MSKSKDKTLVYRVWGKKIILQIVKNGKHFAGIESSKLGPGCLHITCTSLTCYLWGGEGLVYGFWTRSVGDKASTRRPLRHPYVFIVHSKYSLHTCSSQSRQTAVDSPLSLKKNNKRTNKWKFLDLAGKKLGSAKPGRPRSLAVLICESLGLGNVVCVRKSQARNTKHTKQTQYMYYS